MLPADLKIVEAPQPLRAAESPSAHFNAPRAKYGQRLRRNGAWSRSLGQH